MPNGDGSIPAGQVQGQAVHPEARGQIYGAGSHPAIEWLVGRDNWRTWRFAVRTFLEIEHLWDTLPSLPTWDATNGFPNGPGVILRPTVDTWDAENGIVGCPGVIP